MPIVFAPTNVALTVSRILASDKAKKHLESLGITINSPIELLSSSGGAVVVKVLDGKIALDSSLSSKIFVKEAKK